MIDCFLMDQIGTLFLNDGELFLLRKKVWRMTQLRFLIKLELVNTMPEVYLSAHGRGRFSANEEE